MKLSGLVFMMVVPKVMDYFLGCLNYKFKFYFDGILYLAEQLYYLLELCQNNINQYTIPSFDDWRRDNWGSDNRLPKTGNWKNLSIEQKNVEKYVGVLDVYDKGDAPNNGKVLGKRIKHMADIHKKVNLHQLDQNFADSAKDKMNKKTESSLPQTPEDKAANKAEADTAAKKAKEEARQAEIDKDKEFDDIELRPAQKAK